MKKWSRLIALLLVILTFTVLIPTTMAASITTIKSGTAIALKEWNSKKDAETFIYKLKLDEDSLVTVKWTKNTAKKAYVAIFKDAAVEKVIKGVIWGFGDDAASGSEVYAFSKGTYYVQMYDGNASDDVAPTAKVTFTVVKAPNDANYCLANATTLAASKTVKIGQTTSYNYDRWFKIKLTKKKLISVYTVKGEESSIKICDSKGQWISTSYTDGVVKTDSKQKAGTYYICVRSDIGLNMSDGFGLGTYLSVKWK